MSDVIQPSDLSNLLALLNGRYPAWDLSDMKRMAAMGLIGNRGLCLTDEGRRRATALQEYVDRMKAGIPLNVRTANRASDVFFERIIYGKYDSRGFPYFATAHALFSGECPVNLNGSGEKRSFRTITDPIARSFHAAITNQRKKTSFQVEPYAIQLADFPGPELTCFCKRGPRGAAQLPLRVQSRYPDLAEQLFPGIQWWSLGATDLVGKLKGNRGLGDNVVAVIRCYQLDRPYPRFGGDHGE